MLEKYIEQQLIAVYTQLYGHFGPQNWWPADSSWEMIVGAILTQNTSWKNVELSIINLQNSNLLDLFMMADVSEEMLQEAIRPSGYFRQKSQRLKELANIIMSKYNGNLDVFLDGKLEKVRDRLLSIKGIGPETADSILLYAGRKASFVIDAYTKRIFIRLGYFSDGISYDVARDYFMNNLPVDMELYNEYHALIVACAKGYCFSRKPLCPDCPLNKICAKIFV